jgi:amino acid adenylation domain-containing protein
VRAGLTPDHLAYVLYTSGSTGRPKGVMNLHRGVVNLLWSMRAAVPMEAGERLVAVTTLAFDISVLELFLPLLCGARVEVLARAAVSDPARLRDALAGRGTVLQATPATWRLLVESGWEGGDGLRALSGGEALPAELAARVRERVGALWNVYGPTETTIWSSAQPVEPAGERGPVPIGAPVANTRIYALDGAGGPVPVGVAGELHIGGAGVARGYLGRAALTAERFVPDAFSAEPGARMYRTGDVGRWSRGGRLEYVGRNDAQVKVRGYRIELGEIEARLCEHPSVRETVVLAREDAPGDRRLVAYVVGDATEAEVLRAHLSERLPEYMIPAAYVRLEAMPLTPNGKVDRKALPAPEGGAYATRGYEAPAGNGEEALAEIWGDVLHRERVGRWDNFFELGGHSLLAVRVVSRIRRALGVEVALGEMFVRPVLADFARELEKAARANLPPIEPVERGDGLPLSFAQQRLWFLAQMGTGESVYHLPAGVRLKGELDRSALVRALDRIVARHEALRTTFAQVDGQPVQWIAPAEASAFRLLDHDLGAHPDADAELRRVMAEEADAPFDLERGPLIRGRLVRLAADDHVLLVTLHHIVSDGWSMGVLTHELSALYGAFHRGESDPLPALAIQYADYAAWQRRWVEADVLQAQAEYWKTMLAGAPELLALPTDHPRPMRQDHTGAAVDVVLDEALTARLKALSQRHGATLFMTLLAGWATVLGRLSGQEDVVVGTPSANRGRSEIEGLIGFFVNTLALRVDLSASPTVTQLLERVKARALGAQASQDIPFEQVVELVQPSRSLAHTPLFQVLFTWQNAAEGRLDLPGLTPAPVEGAEHTTAKFDLSLTLSERDGRIVGGAEYATALFEQATIERYLGYLRQVLEAMAAAEHQRIEELPLLSDAERRQVVEEWNATEAAYPAGSCLHELFEAQAERTPDVAAVVFEGEALTYAALNARANRLAHHLHGLGVGPDVRVGVCVERGLEMGVGVLGVLKAGGAYVPLDPEYPEDRLRYVLQDSAPAALLTQASLAERFAGVETRVVALDADASSWAGEPEANPDRAGLTPDHLAYVLYTSGSTGRPKGVMNLHRGVVNLLWSMRAAVPMEAGERLVAVTTLAFDISVLELFLPLLCGARVEVLARAAVSDPARLRDALAGRGTVLQATPATWRLLVESGWEGGDGLRALSGGEALPAELAARVRERVGALWNVYGPTETTIWSSAQPVEPAGERGPVPIGAPVANTRIYALDGAGGPVPVGVAGELHIGGAGVARGYLGRAALTAERFVPDAFSAEPGARMYRTGDVGRWSRGGRLEYVGRNDAQVKVRGYRIELGEIEARLCEHPSVRETVVLAREDAPGDRRLVAYVVGDATEAEALRAHLSERLPEYMVPAAYVRLEAMPLTPNGKVDRKALPAPEGGAYATRGYEAPAGNGEEALAEIWGDVLHRERVGRWDNFFELGGHSLLAVRVVSRIRQALGVEVALGEMFVRPVLADFARELEKAVRAELPAIEPVERGDGLPLSFAQQRLWFLAQLGSGGSVYHLPVGVRLRGELDRGALVRALDRIVARHEALRTTFAQVDGQPVQRITPADSSAFRLLDHDLRTHPDADAELRRVMAEEEGAPFDLERGPLIRGRLVRLAADDHVLLVTMHHIVSDGWSMGVLTRELGVLYGAFQRGESDPLPPLSIQYADYAAWQRRWVEGDVLQAQGEYWKTALAGAPELLELPADRPRPIRQDFAGAAVDVVLDEELTAGLKALSKRNGTTLFMTLLAGWSVVLSRLSGQEDVVVGTPSANRGRSEIEGLIGFFVNTLPLRLDLSASPSVSRLLKQVKDRALGAQASQDIPFEQVVELVRPARSLAHTPLFQVTFAWENAGESRPELPGLTLAPVEGSARTTAKFDLSLALSERDGQIVGGVEYATALFDRATVERHLGCLRRVLEAMAADEQRQVADLPLLSESERRRVVETWNATNAAYPADACVHELFEAHAARTPDAPVVEAADGVLTYAELNARANRLAHHLRGLGVGPDTRVALCLERGAALPVAMLAVLKAGGAYVSLDPAYPAERLRFMLADSAPAVVLTQARLAGELGDLFAGSGAPVLSLDAAAPAWADESEANPGRAGVHPEHLAYVIYTSGSTGQPKGVMVAHRGLANLVAWHNGAFGLRAGERASAVAGLGFDATGWEVWPPLCAGATLLLPPHGSDPQALLEWWAAAELDVGFLPTPLAEAAFAQGLSNPRLRVLLVGGDRLRRVPQDALFTLVNNYGPTETTVVATSGQLAASARPHIGRPVSNTRVYLLDRRGEPVPVGVAGELYVAGAQVARGYLDRPGSRPSASFPTRSPRSRGRGCTAPATWRGGWRTGAIDFVGRHDFQVKVRGFRIELGEIEARLAEHPSVREAVVVAREDVPGETRLVAYGAWDAADAETLRAHLSERLPEYMVPAAYVRLDALPLTPNGKVDRRALPAPEGDAYATRAYEAPAGDTEQALAEIWAELLGAERVGRRDDFFALGGHSLLAVQAVSRVRQVMGVEASLGDLFVRPALADFARGWRRAGGRSCRPSSRWSARDGWRFPSPSSACGSWSSWGAGAPRTTSPAACACGARWTARRWPRAGPDRGAPRGAAHHLPRRRRRAGAADRRRGGERLLPPRARPGRARRGGGGARAHHGRRGGAAFDLARGPLVRGRLVRLADDEHVLLVTMHHVVSDGWSDGGAAPRAGRALRRLPARRADPLPPLPVQYADYAAWQRRWVEGEVLRRQAAYWKDALAGAPELLELPRTGPGRRGRTTRAPSPRWSWTFGADGGAQGARPAARDHAVHDAPGRVGGGAGPPVGQDDVVVGTPTANRGRREIEGLIGFFVNTLALRLDLSGAPTVAELLARVKGGAGGAAAPGHPLRAGGGAGAAGAQPGALPALPGDVRLAERAAGGLELPGLRVRPWSGVARDGQVRPVALAAEADGRRRRIAGPTPPRSSSGHGGALARLPAARAGGDGGGRAPRRTGCRSFPRRSGGRWWRTWNAPTRRTRRTRASTTSSRRRRSARPTRPPSSPRTDNSPTASWTRRRTGWRTTSARWAWGPTRGWGSAWSASLEMMVGLLAILKAGGAYVPLDPAYPAERLRGMLEDSAPAVLLTHGAPAGLFRGNRRPGDRPRRPGGVGRPAGNGPGPRGAHPRPPVLRHLHLGVHGPPQGGGERAPQRGEPAGVGGAGVAAGRGRRDPVQASLSFDGSLRELFWPLGVGARVVCWRAGGHRDPDYLLETIRRQRIGTVTPRPLHAAGAAGAPGRGEASGLRQILCGGEALPAALVRRLRDRFPGVRLFNLYGPTEAATALVALGGRKRRREAFPSAAPSPTRAPTCWTAGAEPVPVGVAGELYVGGAGWRSATWAGPGLTAERFVPDPFGERRGGAAVPHRRPGAVAGRRADRVPGPQRLPGEGPRLPHRAGRDRGAAPGAPGGAPGRGAGARGRARRPCGWWRTTWETRRGGNAAAHLREGSRSTWSPRRTCGWRRSRSPPAASWTAGRSRRRRAPRTGRAATRRPSATRKRRWRRSGRRCWGWSAWAAPTTSSSWAGTRSWPCRWCRGCGRCWARRSRSASSSSARCWRTSRGRWRRGPRGAAPIEPRSAAPPGAFVRAAAAVVPGAAGEPGGAYHVPVRLRLRGELDRARCARAGPDRGAPRGAAHHLRRRWTASRSSGSRRRRRAVRPSRARPGRPSRRRGGAAPAVAEEAGAPFDLARGPLIRGRAGPAGGGRPRAAADHAPHRLRRLVHGRPRPRAGRALRRVPRGRRGDPLPRSRCSTPTTRRGSGAGWRASAAGQAEYWTRTRSPARRSCWSCRPTIRGRRSRTTPGLGGAGAGRGADGGAQGARGGTGPRCS